MATDLEFAVLAPIVLFLLGIAGWFLRILIAEAKSNRDRLTLARAACAIAIALGGTAAAFLTPNPTLPIGIPAGIPASTTIHR